MYVVPGTFSAGTSFRHDALILETKWRNSMASPLMIRIVEYFFAPVSPIVVRTVPKTFNVLSSTEVAPFIFAVITHQVQPVSEET